MSIPSSSLYGQGPTPYELAEALDQAKQDKLLPIRHKLDGNGFIQMRAANGERRSIASGTAWTILAGCGSKARGAYALLWYRSKA